MISPYLNLLALNNITQVLTFDERVFIRKKLLDNLQDVACSERITELLSIIKKHNWERPHVEYKETDQGKELFYYDEKTESLISINDYKHSILEEVKPYNFINNE
ncbi:hypothetical protein P3875_01240 [Myroides sp. JBRI-B21084]|uniref:hypothetical protein n=1 Tax=Myroides sp. JBRI-B21084 TaxID=3119977 RepID=UPI0026E2405C|nr:hypothetical protein [Paenimyroides cloacae]WKW46725.1 hypothetical protein P3875_01240 [Paenimyroides cloacae]